MTSMDKDIHKMLSLYKTGIVPYDLKKSIPPQKNKRRVRKLKSSDKKNTMVMLDNY